MHTAPSRARLKTPIKGFDLVVFGRVCLLATFLASCQINIWAEIFVTNVFSNKPASSIVDIEIEVTSCEQIDSFGPQILNLFNDLSEAEIVDCEMRGFESFVIISSRFEIASDNSSYDIIFFREKYADEEINGVTHRALGLKPLINPVFVKKLNGFFEERNQSFDPEKLTIELELRNDDTDILVSGSFIWVNNDPTAFLAKEKLPLGKIMRIKLSNAHSALAASGKQEPAVFLYRPIKSAGAAPTQTTPRPSKQDPRQETQNLSDDTMFELR